MSETPERKVLKGMLAKLKTKVIDSQNAFAALSVLTRARKIQDLEGTWNEIGDFPKESKPLALVVFAVFQSWNQDLEMLNANMVSLIGDMNLYIETLEGYSSELDKTLTKIFGDARQYAEKCKDEQRKQQEEQLKQQEELMKKQPAYRA